MPVSHTYIVPAASNEAGHLDWDVPVVGSQFEKEDDSYQRMLAATLRETEYFGLCEIIVFQLQIIIKFDVEGYW